MKNTNHINREGFTLIEALLAVSLTGLVIAAVLSTYIWCGRIAKNCETKGWVQSHSLHSSRRLMACIQNASGIVDIDDTNGTWVELSYPNGTTGTLSFTSSPTTASGAFSFEMDDGQTTWIIDSGITNNTKISGAQPAFFTQFMSGTNISPNMIQVRYSVAKPDVNGTIARAGSDAQNVTFTACLRNFTP